MCPGCLSRILSLRIRLRQPAHIPRNIGQITQLGPVAAAAFDPKVKDPAKHDKTHLSAEGAAKTAELVAEEIRKNVPDLAGLLNR